MTDQPRTMIRERPLLFTPVAVRVAAFWYRTVAVAIDVIPLLTMWLIILFATGLVDVSDLPESRWNAFYMIVDLINDRPEFFLPPLLALLGLLATYYLVQELVFGQTIGKRLLNLTVVDVRGRRPLPIMVVVRNLVRLFSLLLVGLGYLWAAFDTERRTLHDWISGTWVIHRTDKVPLKRE